MNLLRAAEFKVGLMVLAVSSLIAYMSMQVTEDPTYLGRSNQAWFMLPDAAGLVKNSAVKMAGIPVGVIKNISLQDGMAKVELTMRPDIKLYVSSEVMIKSQGILGDRYIEIYPGSPTDPPLARNGQILVVKDKGSLDNVVSQIGEITDSLKEVAAVLKESVSEDGNRKHVLGRIVLNIEKLTADVAQMTTANKDKVGEIVDKINRISTTLDETLNDETDEGFKKTWKRALARIDSTLKNVDEISEKINRGEGTIGRLINDEDTVEELNTAIEGVNDFLGTAGKLQTGVDFSAQYLGDIGSAKSNIGVRLQPGPDRYYYIGIVDDPSGKTINKNIDTTTTGTNPADNSTRERTTEFKPQITLQFAKNYYDFTVRGGLIEDYGGVGMDYFFDSKHQWKFSLEALQFSTLNLRSQLTYNLYKGIYVQAGMQDILNRANRRSGYLGAGLFISNDDLKLITTALPFMN